MKRCLGQSSNARTMWPVSYEMSWITLQNMLITFGDLYPPVGKIPKMRDIYYCTIVTP